MHPAPQVHCAIMDVYPQSLRFAIGAPFKRVFNMFTKLAGIDWSRTNRDLVCHSNHASQAQNGAFSVLAFAPVIHVSFERHPAVTDC